MVKSRNNRKTRNNRKSRNNRNRSRNNRKASRRQRGGALAPFSTGDAYLLNAAARVQAQTDGLDSAFAELPSVIPRQGGGRRSRRQRGGMQDWTQAYEKPLMAGMSQTAGSRSRSRRRSQRGGMADFNASPMLLDKGQYGAAGQNVQFQNEAGVNPSYREFAGPQ